MTTRINPPSFSSAKSYERFKQEILAWREITELSKTKHGIAVALSLPEEDESQIKDGLIRYHWMISKVKMV